MFFKKTAEIIHIGKAEYLCCFFDRQVVLAQVLFDFQQLVGIDVMGGGNTVESLKLVPEIVRGHTAYVPQGRDVNVFIGYMLLNVTYSRC